MNKFIVLIFLSMLVGCKAKTIYQPLETTKHAYHERIVHDSVHLHDSVLVRMKNDTVFFEKYRTFYRDRIKTDSIYKIDSVAVPYPVVEYREVNRLNSFQSFQLWCGRILLAIVLLFFGIKYIKKFL